MCVYLYVYNKYTQYTYIYYAKNKQTKKFILNVINYLTALRYTSTIMAI